MDEVGRGTTVVDGLTIVAYAAIYHFISKNQCRALFAMHFYKLLDMVGYRKTKTSNNVFNHIDFFCINLMETVVSDSAILGSKAFVNPSKNGHFTYIYDVSSGVNRDSHGLKVAQLAGMPPEAVAVAKDALQSLRAQRSNYGEDLTTFS